MEDKMLENNLFKVVTNGTMFHSRPSATEKFAELDTSGAGVLGSIQLLQLLESVLDYPEVSALELNDEQKMAMASDVARASLEGPVPGMTLPEFNEWFLKALDGAMLERSDETDALPEGVPKTSHSPSRVETHFADVYSRALDDKLGLRIPFEKLKEVQRKLRSAMYTSQSASSSCRQRIVSWVHVNTDGILEWQMLIRRIKKRVKLSKDNLRAMKYLLDADGDGFISVNELRHFVEATDEDIEKLSQMRCKPLKRTQNGKVRRLRRFQRLIEVQMKSCAHLFVNADSDGNNKLNRKEFSKIVRTMKLHPTPNTKELRQLFGLLDVNKDGEISWQEINSETVECGKIIKMRG
jgi:Ca2+-binding EF-hand superfamily protein